MKVWIDQKYCTGDNLCEDLCPEVFTQLDDGLSYVKQGEVVLETPGGRESFAVVAAEHQGAVREAADQCAGECIFIEE
ncbi:MAG: ferredoxin [Candidatus Dormibacteria bacterium]